MLRSRYSFALIGVFTVLAQVGIADAGDVQNLDCKVLSAVRCPCPATLQVTCGPGWEGNVPDTYKAQGLVVKVGDKSVNLPSPPEGIRNYYGSLTGNPWVMKKLKEAGIDMHFDANSEPALDGFSADTRLVLYKEPEMKNLVSKPYCVPKDLPAGFDPSAVVATQGLSDCQVVEGYSSEPSVLKSTTGHACGGVLNICYGRLNCTNRNGQKVESAAYCKPPTPSDPCESVSVDFCQADPRVEVRAPRIR